MDPGPRGAVPASVQAPGSTWYHLGMTDRAAAPRQENAEQRIFQAAVDLFAARGFAATGIRQIAEAVGVTTATLYYYARTKDDLLLQIMQTGLAELLEEGQAAVAKAADPASRIRNLVSVHVRFGAVNPNRARVIDNEFQWLKGSHRATIVALRDGYEALWSTAIDEGISTRIFRPRTPSLARLALLEMCSGVAHWYRPDGSTPISEIVVAYQEMALAILIAVADSPSS